LQDIILSQITYQKLIIAISKSIKKVYHFKSANQKHC